jgi:hypothetical protein
MMRKSNVAGTRETDAAAFGSVIGMRSGVRSGWRAAAEVR